MNSRMILFEKIQNARDLGGLQAADGRMIAPGLLIRSANLAGATESDRKILRDKYHLALWIDLRTEAEQKQQPDAVVENAEYVKIPVFNGRLPGISHEKTAGGADQPAVPPRLEDLYRKMVTDESCRKNLGKAARCVMEHDYTKGSVLWHCTEGKDRCGLLTVILLMALTVDRRQIMEDYLLTNEVNQPKANRCYRKMLEAGKSVAEAGRVRDALIVKESYLNEAFAAIDANYPDTDAFLRDGLSVPGEAVRKFRESVLSTSRVCD